MKQIRSEIIRLVHDEVSKYYRIYNDLPTADLWDAYRHTMEDWRE